MGWRFELLSLLLAGEKNRAAFFTLAVLLILGSHFSHASTPQPELTPEAKARISQAENYIKDQSLHGFSLLPQEARTAFSWISGSWHTAGIGQDHTSDASQGGTNSSALEDGNSLSDAGSPFDVLSSFHHKGFLPTHDAMLLGVGVGKNIFDNKLQFTVRPFYGQSWRSLEGYWGSEFALNIAQKSDAMPWGKIALSYSDGNNTLTDHGTGINLHGDIDLTHGFKFTSGIKQNNPLGDGNYTMISWGFAFK